MQSNYVDKKGVERIGFNIRVNEIALQGGKRDAEPKQEKPRQAEDFGDSDVPF